MGKDDQRKQRQGQHQAQEESFRRIGVDLGPHGPFENVVVSETTTTIRRRCVDGGWNLADVVVASRAIRIDINIAIGPSKIAN